MRISDWSSDVCSSDLPVNRRAVSFSMASILPSDAPWSAKDVVTLPTSQRHPFVAWRAFKSKSEDTGFSTSSHRCLLAGEQPAEEPEPIPCRRRSEEHTSELQSLMRTSYAVFCLKKQNHKYK